MLEVKVSLKHMPAQRTTAGKVRLDANGEPLQSIQIIQSPEQKREMLAHMANIVRIFNEQPELFPEGKWQVGIDPKKYTVEEMITDFTSRFNSWYAMSNNHLYASFVERHNWLVHMIALHLKENGLQDMADYVNETYPIKLRLPKHIEIYNSIQKNDLFELPK